MTDKKPFLSITPDVDDDAIAALARTKGVPELTGGADPKPRHKIVVATDGANDRQREPRRAGEGHRTELAPIDPATVPLEATPRHRISYVKAGIPDYALIELKTRALHQKVSLNHLLLTALRKDGITIHEADLIEDGRRLR